MDPRALEAVLRDPGASLEGTSFLGRALGREVARDPFGLTFEAESATGEPAHVRFVLPDPQSGEAGQLGRVARVVAKGRPPAVPTALAFGTVDGVPWLDLPRPAGVAITERLALGALDVEEACVLVATLARSLGELHMRGGFHGSIRPGSVLLGAQGLELVAPCFSGWSPWRVALAGALAAGPRGAHALDALAAAAPEQLAARDAPSARAVAPSNDVYGLGVLLYTLVCGRSPYRRAGAGETIEAVLRGSPERPRSLAPGLSRALEEVVLGCLSKSPGHRPMSALALAEVLVAPKGRRPDPATSDAALLALQRASDASGVAPPPPPPRGKPWPVLVALAIFALVATGVGLAFQHQRRGARDTELAMGDASFAHGDADGALAAFERARLLDPESPAIADRIAKAKAAREVAAAKAQARELLGKALAATPRSQTRIELVEKACTLDPACVEAQRERARILVARAQDEPRGGEGRRSATARARAAVDALLAAGGKTADDALLEAKVLALERKDPTGALERAAEADPRSVAGAAAAAQLALRRGDPRGASAAIERALAIEHYDARLLLVRARVRRALGEPERARTDLDAALAADPDDRAVRVAALDALIEARDLDRARRMLDERPIDSERDPDLIAARAYLSLVAGKKDSAADGAARALALDASCVRAKVVRGRLALQKSDLGAARRDFEDVAREGALDAVVALRALEATDLAGVQPERVDVLLEVAQALDASNERVRARLVLDRACALAPGDARARLLRGQVHASLMDFERALLDADAVLRTSPDDVRAHALRGRILEGQGRLEDAVGEWTRAIDLAPQHVEFHALRGLLLFDLKRFDEARGDLQLYLDTSPKGAWVERVRNTLERIKK